MALEQHKADAPKALGFALVTISDTREPATDRGGEYLAQTLEAHGHTIVRRALVRDEPQAIREAVASAAADAKVDLVLTTGGTGIAPRDVTYDTLQDLFDTEIPGFGELFRWLSFREIGSAAMLSRALGGLLNGKVVLAMPGSPNALRLALEEIVLKEAGHLVEQQRSRPSGAASQTKPARPR